jgi:hypothetical protein
MEYEATTTLVLRNGKIETMEGKSVIAPSLVQTFLAGIGEGAMCSVFTNNIIIEENGSSKKE